MRIVKNRKGQFIVIAVLMISLMVVSIGVIMYSAGTYYRQEQWEEYITVVEHIRLSTIRLAEISLANYTESGNNAILNDNLNQWQNDLRTAYPGYGVILTYDLVNSTHQVYGTTVSYSQGLGSYWNEKASCSAANATFALNITSVGLEGYRFKATVHLVLIILSVDVPGGLINVVVRGEDGMPVTDLKKENFQVEGLNITRVSSSYDESYALKYSIQCENLQSSNVTVTVRDQRGIKVIAKS